MNTRLIRGMRTWRACIRSHAVSGVAQVGVHIFQPVAVHESTPNHGQAVDMTAVGTQVSQTVVVELKSHKR